MNIVNYNYNGSEISFLSGENVMLNATQMAKPFNKTTKDWLRNNQTNEFLSTLSAVRQIRLSDLVTIKQGGNGEQGTWFHEDVALEFARWLSPAFAIGCNDRIKELLKSGVATISNDDDENSLNGTTWVCDDTVDGHRDVYTLEFSKNKVKVTSQCYEGKEVDTDVETFSYSYDPPLVTIDGEILKVNGNKMTTEPDEDGDYLVYIKK